MACSQAAGGPAHAFNGTAKRVTPSWLHWVVESGGMSKDGVLCSPPQHLPLVLFPLAGHNCTSVACPFAQEDAAAHAFWAQTLER